MTNAPIVNLDGLTIDEKLTLLNELGETVLEATLLRLVSDLSDDQQEALEQFMETDPEPDVLLKHLFEHHKDFEKILTEEAKEMQGGLADLKTE